MAKKVVTKLDAPGVLTPLPAQPVVRDHVWQRAEEHTEDIIEHDYPLQLPRWLSKEGEPEQKFVRTPKDCEDALNAGWVVHPGNAPRTA